MKNFLLLFISLTLSAHTLANWSRYAHVTPKSENAYDLNVYVSPTNEENTTYLIRLPAISFPSKQAWLIVTPKPISPKEQNQRTRFWGDDLNTKNIESIIPLRPNGIPIFSQADEPDIEKYYEVIIPAHEADRAYIYIDFPTPVSDGGYFYSIDIGSYVKEIKK